ncbi:MAG: glycosyltransferase family 2 protein [Spirochaetes bacterium]|nr:glycosyltransferase family 2 protein [Spirochaetota bacterium]
MERPLTLEGDLLDNFDISSLSVGNTAQRTKAGITFHPNVTSTMSFFLNKPIYFHKYRRYYLEADVEPIGEINECCLEIDLSYIRMESPYGDRAVKQPSRLVDSRIFVRKSGSQELFDTHYLIEDIPLWIRLIVKESPTLIKKLLLYSEPVVPSTGEKDYLLGTDGSVSVVIVTYNKRQRVLALIESLMYLDISFDRLKVVVVDNSSTDDTVSALKEKYGEKIEILPMTENVGGSGGFNRGMRHVMENHSSDLIWLLDNDVVVEKETLSALLTEIKADDRTGAVGSMMCKLDNQFRINELGGFIDWRNTRLHLNAHNLHIRSAPRNAQQVDYCAATSLLTKKTVINQIGYWDDVFIHFDDVEWCLRMNAAGWRVISTPKSRIWHESADIKLIGPMRYYDIRNFLRIYNKYRPNLISRAIGRFKRQGLYFKMHGFKRTARLICEGIHDFKKGITGEKTIQLERRQPLTQLENRVHGRRKYFVFHDIDALQRAMRRLPYGFVSGETVFLYDKRRLKKKLKMIEVPLKVVAPRKKGKLSRIIVYLRQIASTRGRNKIVIVDGAFERRFLPPAFKNALFLYTRSATFIDTGKQKE